MLSVERGNSGLPVWLVVWSPKWECYIRLGAGDNIGPIGQDDGPGMVGGSGNRFLSGSQNDSPKTSNRGLSALLLSLLVIMILVLPLIFCIKVHSNRPVLPATA